MDGDITRAPVNTPAEAMALVATLCGGQLGLGIDLNDDLPEFGLTLRAGEHEAVLRAWVDMRGEDPDDLGVKTSSGSGLVMVLRIKCDVTWCSSHYGPEAAATVAALHTLAAQKAMLVDSVAQGRWWLARNILGDDA